MTRRSLPVASSPNPDATSADSASTASCSSIPSALIVMLASGFLQLMSQTVNRLAVVEVAGNYRTTGAGERQGDRAAQSP